MPADVMSEPAEASPAGRRPGSGRPIPLALKIVYTLYVAVLVPLYWKQYGPTNFLYFCDLALLGTVPALWLESRRLINIWTVMILIPQGIWVLDFIIRVASGWSPLGMTSYMFDPSIPLLIRGLSTFHIWLPALLVGLTWRLGYDRRAFPAAVVVGTALLLFCYFVLPAIAPPPTWAKGPININYVYGLDSQAPQTWMPPLLWLGFVIAFYALACCGPAHLLLKRLRTTRSL